MLHSLQIDTPFGLLTLIADRNGLVRIILPGVILPPDLPAERTDHPHLHMAARQIHQYAAGKRTRFTLPLSLAGSGFQRQAWLEIGHIPYGCTASYKDIAERLGDGRKARAVGAAARANPLPLVIPCHRVIGSDGRLTGFAAGLRLKRQLLEHEGVRID